jgi:hypothetical protein
MKHPSSRPPKNQKFVETRARLHLSIPEFALLLGISTKEVVLFECGKKLLYDRIYQKLDSITRLSQTPKPEPSDKHIKKKSPANRKYDTNDPLLAIFKEVNAIQEKINTDTPPKKKRPTRIRRNKRNPNQLSLMFAIKEANYPNEIEKENMQIISYDIRSEETDEIEDPNKKYLLRKVHTELNQFNKHFNHYTLHNYTLRASDPASQAIFFDLKQIRDSFIRELFNLQKIITTEDLPFIELLSKIDFTSRQYTDKMLLKLKEFTKANDDQPLNAPLLLAK